MKVKVTKEMVNHFLLRAYEGGRVKHPDNPLTDVAHNLAFQLVKWYGPDFVEVEVEDEG